MSWFKKNKIKEPISTEVGQWIVISWFDNRQLAKVKNVAGDSIFITVYPLLHDGTRYYGKPIDLMAFKVYSFWMYSPAAPQYSSERQILRMATQAEIDNLIKEYSDHKYLSE